MKYLLLILFLLSNIALASIGTVSSFKGSVQIQRMSESLKATLGFNIQKNDIINTKDNSNVIIQFKDNTLITVGKNSTLSIKDYTYDKKNSINSKVNFSFLRGTFKSVTGAIGKINPKKFILHTKTANIGIRGTTIIANQEIVACTDGEINVLTKNKNINISKDQYINTTDKNINALALTNEILNILYDGLGQDFNTNNKSNEKLELLKMALDKGTTNIKKQEGGNINENSSNEEKDHP